MDGRDREIKSWRGRAYIGQVTDLLEMTALAAWLLINFNVPVQRVNHEVSAIAGRISCLVRLVPTRETYLVFRASC